MKVKESFSEASTSGSKDKSESKMDLYMLTTFLETSVKLLRDSKVVKGLQELINRCIGTAADEPCVA